MVSRGPSVLLVVCVEPRVASVPCKRLHHVGRAQCRQGAQVSPGERRRLGGRERDLGGEPLRKMAQAAGGGQYTDDFIMWSTITTSTLYTGEIIQFCRYFILLLFNCTQEDPWNLSILADSYPPYLGMQLFYK